VKAIDARALVTATGGLKTAGRPMSTNIEDRRTEAGIARDNAWWKSLHPAK
jgi:hypothetical protein